MGEASSFLNRWACQHACKEGRERTVRVTEESNTKTDLSSRLASRIIMPRMACISAQEEASGKSCTGSAEAAEWRAYPRRRKRRRGPAQKWYA